MSRAVRSSASMERPSKDGFPPPAGGMSPSRTSERRVPDGKKPKLNTCWSLTLEKDFPCCALNRAEGCHVLFHSPQFQPSDSVILPSPKHRCRGGSMATRLKPAAVRVLGLSRQVCSRGIPRAKSKQNTLRGSEAEEPYSFPFLCHDYLCLLYRDPISY